jgi:hypothetical protein
MRSKLVRLFMCNNRVRVSSIERGSRVLLLIDDVP